MLHPRDGTVTNCARVFVASAFGHTARNSMMDLIEKSEAEIEQYKKSVKYRSHHGLESV
jgi:hypothetical protein